MANNIDDDSVENSKAPLVSHLIELRDRLKWAVIAFFIAFLISYFFADYIYGFLVKPLKLTYQDMGYENPRMIYTGLTEAFFTYLKVSFYTALFISFPVIATQIYKFAALNLKQKRMSTNLKVRKGLNIRLQGDAEKVKMNAPNADVYAVKPTDFHGVTPKLLVKVARVELQWQDTLMRPKVVVKLRSKRAFCLAGDAVLEQDLQDHHFCSSSNSKGKQQAAEGQQQQRLQRHHHHPFHHQQMIWQHVVPLHPQQFQVHSQG